MPDRIQRRRERRSCNSLRVTFRALIVRVLVASPSDVLTGRDTVESAINRWNIDNASDAGVVLLPVRWETSATAEIGGAPQDVINRQLVETSDILIGIFGTRLGSPTATNLSGTAEEIQQFLESGRPATVYFSNERVAIDDIDADQLSALRSFRKDLQTRGLLGRYDSEQSLQIQVYSYLVRIVRERFRDEADASDAGRTGGSSRAAHVVAGLVYHGDREQYIELINEGDDEARGVTVSTEPESEGSAWVIIGGEEPVQFLRRGATLRLHLALDMGSAVRVTCIVSWTNPDGSPGSSRQTLSFG
jgi:hypothetical protein